MFEKFSNSDVDSAGRGGEYTVQAGFGWTNGVVLWAASNYGNILVAPTCPPLLAANANSGGSGEGQTSSAIALTLRDGRIGRLVTMSSLFVGLVCYSL